MREIFLPNATGNWYVILYDLVSRLWFIVACGHFCKGAPHIDGHKLKQAISILAIVEKS